MKKNNVRLLLTAGFTLGVGMGGFVDGILFHQILQLHNMLSNIIFPDTLVKVEINMFWDGLFHAFTWSMTAAGISLLWQVAKDETVIKSNKIFLGSLCIGFGAFNFIEGLIDHHILKLHHVLQRATGYYQALGDFLFLASGIILIIVGLYCILHFFNKSKSKNFLV